MKNEQSKLVICRINQRKKAFKRKDFFSVQELETSYLKLVHFHPCPPLLGY